ncbi:TetR family transcriptional regulator [Chitinophaga sp. 22620]|uniref:TetR family transcriptional regulator n=1 Tax=Chitinophaga sp. 22620 TaxID=3453952 RepID=UPI003F862604
MKKAEATRQTILHKAFELIYTKGYQATSLDDILATTQVTKGAFYYHFRNKDEMGLAIIEEVLKPAVKNNYILPLQQPANPLTLIYDMMRGLLINNPFLKVEYGCPAANLTQEMAPWNEAFSQALGSLTGEWNNALVRILEKGKKDGLVNKKVNARQVALFVMSGYWGIRNFGKLANSSAVYRPYLKELKAYLEMLA